MALGFLRFLSPAYKGLIRLLATYLSFPAEDTYLLKTRLLDLITLSERFGEHPSM